MNNYNLPFLVVIFVILIILVIFIDNIKNYILSNEISKESIYKALELKI